MPSPAEDRQKARERERGWGGGGGGRQTDGRTDREEPPINVLFAKVGGAEPPGG